ncbi:tail assembly protein [Enterococcus phage vB_EfaS_Ef6.4]|nr:tail assembly protein [Enterococcus phage vB_EfaS_Ef6.4]
MDFYITDRNFKLETVVSTTGNTIFKVISAEDVSTLETSSRRMTMEISFTPETTDKAKEFFKVGNYVLYIDLNGKHEWMTILKSTHNPLTQIRTLECEDAGLDLLNETVSDYKADKAYNVAHYIERFTYDSGFKIGLNEISKLTRKLEWEGEATALERIQSVATQFDNAEIEFRFEFIGNQLSQRYIDIKKKRGTTDFHRMFVNKDIHSIVVEEDIYQLVNAIYATGGTEEGKDQPINLKGFTWTDPEGRFVLNKTSGIIRDTQNIKQWSRDNTNSHYFLQHKQWETTNKTTLVNNVVSHLKKYSQPITNYIVDIANIPDILQVGDTVELVDENEKLYLSSRVQQLTFRYESNTCEAVLSDFVRLESGIAEQLREIQININNKTEQMFNSVPQVFVQQEEPATPKENDIWWVQEPVAPAVPETRLLRLNAVADTPTTGDVMVTAYKVYKDGAWQEQTIDQSVLNIETLNAVNINGSTINGSEFINTWNTTEPISGGQARRQGTTVIENGAIIQDNDTFIIPTGSTLEKLRTEETTKIQYGQVINTINNYDVATGTKIERKSNGLLSANRVYLNELDYTTSNTEINQQATLEPRGLSFVTTTKEGSNPAVLTGTTELTGGLIKVNGHSPNISAWGEGTNITNAKSGNLFKFGNLVALGFNTDIKALNGLVQKNQANDAFQAQRDAKIKFQATVLFQGENAATSSDYAYCKMQVKNTYNELKSTSGGVMIASAIGTGTQDSIRLQWVGTATVVIDVKAGQWFGCVLELRESRNNLFAMRLVNVQLEELFPTA